MKILPFAYVAAALSVPLGVSATYAQQLETPAPPTGTPPASPYLTGDAIDYRSALAPPPMVGSARDDADLAGLNALLSRVDAARWQMAEDDANYVYARFEESFGRPITRAALPLTVNLLNRTLRDVVGPILKAKVDYPRARPRQRLQLSRVCGQTSPPPPDTNALAGDSYPSGHSAYGWAVAMVLAQVAPERGQAVLERAAKYAESRVICGAHFPSDTDAGRVIAVVVVERLQASPTFQADLACAKHEMVPDADKSLPTECRDRAATMLTR